MLENTLRKAGTNPANPNLIRIVDKEAPLVGVDSAVDDGEAAIPE